MAAPFRSGSKHRSKRHPPAPAAPPTVTRRYDLGHGSVHDAREFTRDTLVAWGRDDLVDAAELVVSEFVTRSIDAGSPGTIMLHRSRDHIHVEVTADRADFAEDRSLGNVVVDAASSTWGVSYTWPHYRSIWSDLD